MWNWWNWGLRKKFVAFFLVFITIPTMIFGIFIYYETTNVLKQRAQLDVEERLKKSEQNLSSIMSGVENISSYMIYDHNFRTFFLTPKEGSFNPEFNRAIEAIKGYFTFQLMSNPYITSISLDSYTGNTITIGEPISGEEETLLKTAINAEGVPVWSEAYKVHSAWTGEKHVVSLARVINDINRINEPIGIVRIRIDVSNLYQTIVSSLQGNYMVMSDNGVVILHQDPTLVGNPFPDLELIDWAVSGNQSSFEYKTEDNNYLAVKSELNDTNWLSIEMVDEGNLVQELYEVRALIRDMIIILILLGVIVLIVFYHSNIKRIIELINQTKQVESGNFAARVIVNSSDEIGKLGKQFNVMVQTIQDYINKEFKLKIKQKESELKALQSQINPHFLYNTLDMIRWTARIEKAPETAQLIEKLSSVFRMTLNNNTWILLEKELNYIKAYLDLQKSRMGDKLAFHIFVDCEVKDCLVMKQLLQPLVENSIVHGFKNLSRQGKITIRCYPVDDQLWIDVIDNGMGMDPEQKNVQMNSGFALNNIKERLAIAFGEEYELLLLDAKEGTSLRLILPLIKEEDVPKIINRLGE